MYVEHRVNMDMKIVQKSSTMSLVAETVLFSLFVGGLFVKMIVMQAAYCLAIEFCNIIETNYLST